MTLRTKSYPRISSHATSKGIREACSVCMSGLFKKTAERLPKIVLD